MNYIDVFENERGFNIRYNSLTLTTFIYDNGIDYLYHAENEKTIEDVEKMEFVNFDLTQEEREKINYLFLRLNKDDFIEEVFSFYNIEDRNHVIVKKTILKIMN